jgi:hypothetical protein
VSAIVGFNQGLYKVVEHPAEARTVVRDRLGHSLDHAVLSGSASAASVPGGLQADPDLEVFVSAIHAVRPR